MMHNINDGCTIEITYETFAHCLQTQKKVKKIVIQNVDWTSRTGKNGSIYVKYNERGFAILIIENQTVRHNFNNLQNVIIWPVDYICLHMSDEH